MKLILDEDEVAQILLEAINGKFSGYGFDIVKFGSVYDEKFCTVTKKDPEPEVEK